MFDLDGTLLTNEKNIDPSSIEALKKYEKGRTLVLISGRHFSDITEYLHQLTFAENLYCISSDGQYLYDAHGNMHWENAFLTAENAKEIFELVKPKRMLLCAKSLNYCVLPDWAGALWFKLKSIIIKNRRSRCFPVKKIDDFVGEVEIEKIILPTALDSDNYNLLSCEYCVHNYKDRCEILNSMVNKYAAVTKFCKSLGISYEELLYFGDDINDIECFENLKNCVAMGNAVDEIKNLACFITKDNNNGGVAFALERLLNA